MALTFAETTKYYNNPIIAGVAQSIIDVNDIFLQIPLQAVEGNAITVNREVTTAGTAYVPVNTATPSPAKTDSVVQPVTYTFVKALGETTLDGMIEDTSLSGGIDAMAIQLASKSKSIGRLHMDRMANGSVVNELNSLKSLLAPGHDVDAGGGPLSFDMLRSVLDTVLAKDGQVDFLMLGSKDIRSLMTLYDSLGGTQPQTLVTNPFTGERRSLLAFEGIPVFRNTFQTKAETADGHLPNEAGYAAGDKSSIYAGCWDDGSRLTGVSMVFPARTGNGGFKVKVVGELEGQDARLVRVVQYCNLINYNGQALTRLYNIG